MGPADADIGYVASDLHLWKIDGLVFDVNIVLQLRKSQPVQPLIAEVPFELFQRFEIVQFAARDGNADVGDQRFLEKTQTLIERHFQVHIRRSLSLQVLVLNESLIKILEDIEHAVKVYAIKLE